MPPKKGAGGGKKRAPKGGKGRRFGQEAQEAPRVDLAAGQFYALVRKLLGGKRVSVLCQDGRSRDAIIPGRMTGVRKRRFLLAAGTYVLVQLLQPEATSDAPGLTEILHVYSAQEAHALVHEVNLSVLLDEEQGLRNMTKEAAEIEFMTAADVQREELLARVRAGGEAAMLTGAALLAPAPARDGVGADDEEGDDDDDRGTAAAAAFAPRGGPGPASLAAGSVLSLGGGRCVMFDEI